MQIKTTLRFHPTTVRIAIIKNTTNSRCWWACGEKGTLYTEVGMQTRTTTLEENLEAS
jgi:hypothetical protein